MDRFEIQNNLKAANKILLYLCWRGSFLLNNVYLYTSWCYCRVATINCRFLLQYIETNWLHSKILIFNITKTCLCNFDPLKPHFYVQKMGFAGNTLFSYFYTQHRLGYQLKPPRWGDSNEYPQSLFRANITKGSHFFHLKLFVFATIKSAIILNGRVFVMKRISKINLTSLASPSSTLMQAQDTLKWQINK